MLILLDGIRPDGPENIETVQDIGYDKANDIASAAAADYLNKNYVDFAFLYLGYTDAAGHTNGWMSDAYMEAIENSCKAA